MVLKLTRIFLASMAFTTMVSCTQDESVADNLIQIQNILEKNNAVNSIQYELTYNQDFPCQVNIKEISEDDGIHWQKNYQFDLTDIAKNSFIQSKPRRRAIIYSSQKQSGDINSKKFKPVKINNFSIRANIPEKHQHMIISEVNKAIALCEEEYSFEESEIQ